MQIIRFLGERLSLYFSWNGSQDFFCSMGFIDSFSLPAPAAYKIGGTNRMEQQQPPAHTRAQPSCYSHSYIDSHHWSLHL
jgi:hypothetical protein